MLVVVLNIAQQADFVQLHHSVNDLGTWQVCMPTLQLQLPVPICGGLQGRC